MLEFSAALAHWSILRILFSRSSCIFKMRTSLQFGAGLVVAGTMMDGLRLPFVQLYTTGLGVILHSTTGQSLFAIALMAKMFPCWGTFWRFPLCRAAINMI